MYDGFGRCDGCGRRQVGTAVPSGTGPQTCRRSGVSPRTATSVGGPAARQRVGSARPFKPSRRTARCKGVGGPAAMPAPFSRVARMKRAPASRQDRRKRGRRGASPVRRRGFAAAPLLLSCLFVTPDLQTGVHRAAGGHCKKFKALRVLAEPWTPALRRMTKGSAAVAWWSLLSAIKPLSPPAMLDPAHVLPAAAPLARPCRPRGVRCIGRARGGAARADDRDLVLLRIGHRRRRRHGARPADRRAGVLGA